MMSKLLGCMLTPQGRFRSMSLGHVTKFAAPRMALLIK